jgi:DnaJ-class molecular chaperone
MAERDYYEILGLSKSASADEVRSAHRRLVRKLHPDVNTTDPKAANKFQEVQEAYDVLSDPDKRKQYDQFGRAGPTPSGMGGGSGGGQYNWDPSQADEMDPGDFANTGQFGDIFDQLFGQRGPFNRGRAGRAPRAAAEYEQASAPSEVEYPVKLSFIQAARGTTLPLTISRGNRSETIDVKIPGGVKTGSRVRIKGKGSIGPNGQGDLFVIVQVTDHAYWRRENLDVLLDVPISVYEALLGTTVSVPTLDGRVTITIPPGTNSGAKLRIKGAGAHRGAEKGDQHCIIKIIVPKNLDAEDMAAIEAIRLKHAIDPRADVVWR